MRARVIAAVVGSFGYVGGCHMIERNDIVRPGSRERVKHPEHPTPKRPTIVITDAGRLRFVEPLECPTEDVISQVAGIEVETKPNLATFVVGIVATSIGGILTIRGISDVDPGGSPFTYAGIGLVGAGLPFAVGPWIGNHTRLVPGRDRPAVRSPGPPEPCGERALSAHGATLHVRGIEIRGGIDRDGVFTVSPYQIVDAFDTGNVPAWDVSAQIDTDGGVREVSAVIDAGTLASHAKAFLASADFASKIEAIQIVPGIVAGALRVNLAITADGPTIRIAMPIKNDGPGPAWALRGHVSAPGLPAIDGRVLYVGALAKGEAREAVLSIPVATDAAGAMPMTTIDFSIELHDAHGTAPVTPVRFRGPVVVDPR